MAIQEFTYGNFFWWISEDDKITNEQEVLFSSNVDLTSNADFVNVSPRISNVITTTDNIESMFNLNVWDTSLILACDDSRNLYKLNSASPSIPVWTTERVVWYWWTSEYLYMFDTSEDIHRILLSDTSNSDWTTFITKTGSVTASNIWTPYIVSDEDTAYIWLWTSVSRVNNSTWVVDSANTFTLSTNIVWLSKIWDKLTIYQENWEMVLRDWIAWSSTERINLWINIKTIKQFWVDIYIIWNWALYKLNWFTLEEIISNSYSDALRWKKIEPIWAIWNMSIWIHTNILYLISEWSADIDSIDWLNFWNNWILTVWNKKKWFPVAVNKFIDRNYSLNKFNDIYWILTVPNLNSTTYSSILYIAYRDELGNYWIDNITLTDGSYFCSDNWIVVLPTFDWWDKATKKTLHKLKLWLDLETSEDNSVVVYKVDNDSTYRLQPITWDLTTSTITKSKKNIDWFYYLEINEDFTEWITIWIVLKNDDNFLSKKDSVKLYSLTYIYEWVQPR